MNEDNDLRKFGADKIVFLGLFVISLLIAWLIVSVKSGLNFSRPIELPHSGLSMVIPTGKGWQNTEQWKYIDNAFVLSSSLFSGKSLAAAVNCRYFLTSQNITPEIFLNQQAIEPNSPVVEKNILKKGNLEIHWAYLEKPFTVYIGTVDLPNNRTVVIEVVQTAFEIDIAEKVFKTIVERMDYKEDNPVKTGTVIVTEMKNKGIDTVLEGHYQQASFFIRDSGNHNIGFTIDLLDNIKTNESLNIRGASQLYFTGSIAKDQATLFQGDKNLNQYNLQSQTNTKSGKTSVEIKLDKTGTLSITNQFGENKYPDSAGLIPSIFIELLIQNIVQDKIDESVIDILDSDGKMSAALFSFKPAENISENITNTVSLRSLDNRNLFETFYLDSNNTILKVSVNEESGYYLEKTDLDSIEREYPGQTSFISQQNQFIESNSL